jgi:hypothetical protein
MSGLLESITKERKRGSQMADVMLNNYSDDSQIKRYISEVIAPRVFKDIPMNVLNSGHFGLINEYMSQAIEALGFTSSFYFNESFITKSVLPDSIYAESALFNIGYAFATPSQARFMVQLAIEDLRENSTYNPTTGMMEFILDKDTKFNLSNGNVYSLDHDILVYWKDVQANRHNVAIEAWGCEYTNLDPNMLARNKQRYILYRVTDVWLCMFVNASEYERETHIVTNTMTNGVPNPDTVIDCSGHICGFDIKYVGPNGEEEWLARRNILPIHSRVDNGNPYVHYIMDNPQTIRFMWQSAGRRHFIPPLNSSYEITVYTCHGKAANFTAFNNDEEPFVLTNSNKYPNNANVMKACFVIPGGSLGGSNINSVEMTRRQTIEAYNTANVISSDNDILQWFKTLFFKQVLYPFFFKRRDDPWGRVWSGYFAIRDDDDHVFRTNTLHAKIPYNVLYNNNENTMSSNEIIIPPGWSWVYKPGNRYTVVPYTHNDNMTVENARSFAQINEKFVFANPFGIRIQKAPFAIGYFNPWVNEGQLTSTHVAQPSRILPVENTREDMARIFHAFPMVSGVKRTYMDNFYNFTTFIIPTIPGWVDGSPLVPFVKHNAQPPLFSEDIWNYFRNPLDLFSPNIPMISLAHEKTHIPFNPNTVFLSVRRRTQIDANRWALEGVWIDDHTNEEHVRTPISITGDISQLWGTDEVWGEHGLWKGHEVFMNGGSTQAFLYPDITHTGSNLEWEQSLPNTYYEFRLVDNPTRYVQKIRIHKDNLRKTRDTRFGIADSNALWMVGKPYEDAVGINLTWEDDPHNEISFSTSNAARTYIPFNPDGYDPRTGMFDVDANGFATFSLGRLWSLSGDRTLLYADMRPVPDDGNIDFYRIPLSALPLDRPLFYIGNRLLPLEENHMRVILHALIDGSEVGRVEMQPVMRHEDGSYQFEAAAHPLNQLIDLDNKVWFASVDHGGGSWVPTHKGTKIGVDGRNAEIKMSILFRSEIPDFDSPIEHEDEFTGFRIADQFMLDDVILVQELKEMRSIVHWDDPSQPTPQQISLYNSFCALWRDSGAELGLYAIWVWAYNHLNDLSQGLHNCKEVETIAKAILEELDRLLEEWHEMVSGDDNTFAEIRNVLRSIFDPDVDTDWNEVLRILARYLDTVNMVFTTRFNVNGGIEVQQVPFVSQSLMASDRFESFVSNMTRINRVIEPVIFHRLEGNNFLDCKLIATYGLPHSYSTELGKTDPDIYWPDLNVQLEYDVRLFNNALATNTINEIKEIIKAYFMRLTTIHTPIDIASMDNNIYEGHIRQQIEDHPNVAYSKFRGWYTDERTVPNGNYMDANQQSIQMKWDTLEDFPVDINGRSKLDHFVPELYTVENRNIVINTL